MNRDRTTIARLAARPGTERYAIATLLAAAFGLQLVELGRPELTLFDESYHAIVARNLLKHPLRFTLYDHPAVELPAGDWHTSHLWLHKPPLALWQIALSYRIFGTNTFALRLPSAILSAGAAFLTYRLGIGLFASRAVGLGAAALQAFNPFLFGSVYGYNFSDHIDIALLFWIELGLLGLARAFRTGRSRDYGLAGAALGLAFLTKAFPSLIVAGILAAVAAARTANLRATSDARISLPGLAAFGVAAAVPVAAWASLAYAAFGWTFIHEAILWLRHLDTTIEGWGAPWDRYLFDYAARNLPWFYVPAMAGTALAAWRALRGHAGDLFVALWAAGVLLPLSAAASKTPSGALPAIPALALAFARLAQSSVRSGGPGTLGAWAGAAIAPFLLGGGMSAVTERDVPHPGPAHPAPFAALNPWVLPHAALASAAAVLLTAFAHRAPRAWPPVRGAAQVAALATTCGLAGRYLQETRRVVQKPESRPWVRAMADTIRHNYPRNAAFVMLERDGYSGLHASLMFWADRSVYSFEIVRWRHPSAAPLDLARWIRAAGGVPYLISDTPITRSGRAADTLYGYWIQELPARARAGGGRPDTRPPPGNASSRRPRRADRSPQARVTT